MRRDRVASERRAISAIERLQSGNARYPRYRGRAVRITVTSVAREAGLSRATVHRLQAVHEQIRDLRGVPLAKQPQSSKKRAASDRIAELEADVQRLVEENTKLSMLLARFDPLYCKVTDDLTSRRAVKQRHAARD